MYFQNITVCDENATENVTFMYDIPVEMDPNRDIYYSDRTNDIARVVMNTIYCLIFFVGVIGNVWVFFLIGRNRQTKAVTNIFIVNLAIADLFLMLFLPIIVAHAVITEWIFGMFMCKLYFTCDGINKFASIMFLVLLSIDRYLAVCHPVASRSVRTVRVAFAMVAASWTLVIALMTPVFLYATLLLNIDPSNRTTIQCSIYWSHNLDVADRARRTFTFYTFSISYLIPLLLIWSFYLLILNRLRRQEKLFNYSSSLTNSSPASSTSGGRNSTTLLRRRRSSRRISIMVLTIVVSYTICWMPYWIIQVSLELFPDAVISLGETFTIFSVVAYGFQYMNSAINPFLYAFGTGSFRQECFDSLMKSCFFNGHERTLHHHNNNGVNYHSHDSPSSCSTTRTTNNLRKESVVSNKNKLSTVNMKDRDNLLRNYFSSSTNQTSISVRNGMKNLSIGGDTKETRLIED